MNIRFDNKTAVLTGASRGLGRAIAMLLAENGADVVIGDVLDEAGATTCQEIQEKTGRQAAYVHVDVRDPDQVKEMFDAVPVVDMVMHGAGITVPENLIDASDAAIKRLFDINILGSSNVVRAALNKMLPQKNGKIVLLSSVAGRYIDKTVTHYRMSKAAMLSLTMSAASFAAPHGINVNAVCPGIVRTEMREQLLDEKMKSMNLSREEAWQTMVGNLVPMGRPQTQEDIAASVAFLLSHYADNITGQALNVDGGQCMQI